VGPQWHSTSSGKICVPVFETLRELNLGHCIAGYAIVLPLNIVSSESFTRHDLPALLSTHFVGDHRKFLRYRKIQDDNL
jgi:hypothetical protein